MRLWPIVLGFVACLLDCATLEPLSSGTCGNGVIDAKEDCDSFPANQCGTPADGARQCRYLCNRIDPADPAKTKRLLCPDGWGCGVDDVCRAPIGTFSDPSASFSAGVTRMLVGDFDGDKRADILGTNGATSKGRIYYFDKANLAEPQIVTLPGVVASPLIYDFDGNGKADIAFGYSFKGPRFSSVTLDELNNPDGLAVFLGQGDRAVVAKLYPSLSVEEALGFDPEIVPLFAGSRGLPKNSEAFIAVVDVSPNFAAFAKIDPGPTLMSIGGRGPNDVPYHRPYTGKLVGKPSSAKLLNVPSSTCGEVIIALNAPARLEVYSPCIRTNAPIRSRVNWAQTLAPIKIPTSGSFNAPIELTGHFIADVDGDGIQDIIIGTTDATAGESKIKIAYGTGAGFEAPVSAPPTLSDVPLAAGYINPGRFVDLVLSDGVLISDDPQDAGSPRSELKWFKVRSPKRWTSALVADVNRDSAPDVIAASDSEADIDVLQGTLSKTLTPFTVPTTGVVTHLTVTDVDFDGTQDIGIGTKQGTSTEIAIAYGRVLTMPPEAPRPAGRVEGMRQLFSDTGGLGISTATSSQPGGPKGFSLSLLLKSPDRQPVAPLLFDPGGPGGSIPRERTTRDLVLSRPRDADNVDLVAVVSATDYDPSTGRTGNITSSVWVAPGTGLATFDPPMEPLELDGLQITEKTTGKLLTHLVSEDLGSEKGWDTVMITKLANSGPGGALFVVPAGGPPNTGGPGGPPMGGQNQPQRPRGISSLGPPVMIADREPFEGTQLELLDIDGDGQRDLVALLKKAGGGPVVSVLFGKGKGAFATPGLFVDLPNPDGRILSPEDRAPVGFARVTTAAGTIKGVGQKRGELFVLTTKVLYRVIVGADRIPVATPTTIFGDIINGLAVAAGDFDGDGVEDLAISDQGSIRIARQTAVNP